MNSPLTRAATTAPWLRAGWCMLDVDARGATFMHSDYVPTAHK